MHYSDAIKKDLITRDIEGLARCVKVFGSKDTEFVSIARRTFEPMRYHISPLRGGKLMIAHAVDMPEGHYGIDKISAGGDFELNFHSNGTGTVYTIHAVLPKEKELRALILASDIKYRGLELWPEFYRYSSPSSSSDLAST